MKSVTRMRWYRRNGLKLSLNDFKYDLKYGVGRVLNFKENTCCANTIYRKYKLDTEY